MTKPESPWKSKPWWCQPWSILLTGAGIIAGSWFLFQKIWLTAIIATPVSAWMGFFLLLWPRLLRRYGLTSQEALFEPLDQRQTPP